MLIIFLNKKYNMELYTLGDESTINGVKSIIWPLEFAKLPLCITELVNQKKNQQYWFPILDCKQ
jgi:hypothetical protein